VNGEASRLRALVEIARLRSTGDDAELLDRMAEATARALRYRTVVVNLYRPAWDDFEVACVHGSDEARAALLGTSTPRRRWRRFLHPRHLSHGVFHLPRGAIDWDEDGEAYVPQAPAGADPGAWHPEDALFAPMRGAGGAVLGVLSVDEPLSGRRPDARELEILGAVASHAGVVLAAAQEAETAERQKAALDQLLRVSAGLGAHATVHALLGAVCLGVAEALGFEKVAVFLADEPGDDQLRPRAQVGLDDLAALRDGMSLEALAPLLAERYEREGCFLASGRTARRLGLHTRRLYTSVRNGRGPYAWNHHWLLVPLHDEAGRRTGLLWADEPTDLRLPSREQLQALRVFANQAASALDAARYTRQLRHLATHDPLTGLRNRRDLSAQIDGRIKSAGGPVSVLLSDLDHFKRINDVRGHEVGDRTLARLGGLLRDLVRSHELAVRLGGEEFALVIRAGPEEGLAAAERLRTATRHLFEPELPELTVSVGVATSGRDGDDAAALLSAADKALYAAKRLGRDRCLAYDPELVARVMAAGDRRGAPRGDLLAPVLLLAETLDLRDPSTARHSQTVGRYAEQLARALDWPPERVERMRIAGLLHDVGKVGVPDAILGKPGPLDAAERALMRRHCELGAQLVEGAGMPDVAGWVLRHHERADGSGYPGGRRGDDVPTEARILAVADAYEAMTADRPYREALGAAEAQEELRRGAASGQFDPGLVAAFLDVVGAARSAPALA
jgi:diguanylate cyclase (GGDEF)-like protein/putative nucleotidyltransferase with HDIG domain